MNNDIMEGRWKQMKGDLRKWWGKLTDNEFDEINGNMEKLAGVLQEKYGYTRAQADQEIETRVREYEAMHQRPSSGQPGTRP